MQSINGEKDYGALSDKVYHYLREGITEGRYQSGEALVELKIAEELGVSRTPVREALKQLELEDLVTSLPNRGVVVKGITAEDINDVFTIRRLLEGQVAYWAAERIDAKTLDHLQEIIELMDLATRKNDSARLVTLDTQFHETLYEACQSRTLKNVLTTLHQNIRRARQSSLTSPERARASLDEHKQIYNALLNHDAPAAKARIERHILGASQKSSGE